MKVKTFMAVEITVSKKELRRLFYILALLLNILIIIGL